MINASASLGIFSIITCLYFLIRYLVIDKYGKNNNTLSYFVTGLYLTFITGSQLSINFKNSKEHCGGEPQLVSTFIYTVLPNFTIFGLIMLLTYIFPGWRAPFSNTFGYAATYLMGIKEVLNNMLPAKSGNKLIQQVYEDSSTLINEINPENFDAFIGRMQENNLLSKTSDEYIPKLYNLVMVKDNIAKLIWYILTGCLVISTSYNAMLSVECSRNPEKLQKIHSKFTKQQNNLKVKKEKKFIITD